MSQTLRKGRFGDQISLKVSLKVCRDQMTCTYVQRTDVLRTRGDTCTFLCPRFSQCAPLITKCDGICHREIIVFRTSFSNHGLSYKIGPVRQTRRLCNSWMPAGKRWSSSLCSTSSCLLVRAS